jgi:hypothetical protein
MIPKKRQFGFRRVQTDFWDRTVVSSREVRKGEWSLMKIGDRVKDKTTGKIYVVRMDIGNDTLCLEGENGLGRRLTGIASLKRTCEKLEDLTP